MRLTASFICLLLCFSLANAQGISRLFQADAQGLQGAQTLCQPLSINSYIWDAGQQAWDESVVTTLSYNDSSWVDSEIVQSFFNGSYNNIFRRTYSYALSGKPTEEVSEVWTGGAWANDERMTFSYDGNDSLIARTNYTWTAGMWDTVSAATYSFTYNGALLTQFESAVWDPGSSTFEPETRERYSYGSNNEIDTLSIDFWISGAWSNSLRYVDIVWFDFPTLLTSFFITQTQSNGNFVDNLRTNNIFSGPFNNKTGYIEVMRNGVWDSLRYTVKRYDVEGFIALSEGYTYDTTLQMHTQSFGTQITNTFDMAGCRLEEITQVSSPTGYQNSTRRVFNNFGVSNAEASLPALQFTAFPNPVSGRLNFRLENASPGPLVVEVFDLHGSPVFEQAWRHTGGILEGSVELNLPAGIYLLKAATKAGQLIQRIAVQ